MRRMVDLGRLAALLPLVWAAACGSINPEEPDGGGTAGGTGAAGVSGAAGAGGTGGATAGTTGSAGSVANMDGSVGKDSGQGDAVTPPDALPSDCMAGDRRCDTNTPLVCDANGVWQRGAACTNMCVAGSCVGICQPGAKMCVGNIPQSCDASGNWQAAPACSYVCRQGDCTGVCQPGARQCSSSGVPQSCTVDGAWDSGAQCPFVCKDGVCSGACKPGDVGCNGNVPQTCSSTGDWQPSAPACQYTCSNGQCAGSCTPGAHQCANNVPQTCTQAGAWQSGSACPYVCSGGMCGGSCMPGNMRCTNGQKQICDVGGSWQDTTTPSMQLLMNPNFDAGHVGWSETTASASTVITNDSTLTTVKAQTPSYLAWLGGYNNAQDDLSQVVTIPAGASSITLSFYYLIQTMESSPAILDTMQVYTYDPASAKYTAVATFNDNMPTSTWTRFSVTLPASLAGMTFELGFQATTDNTKYTNFFLDSVTLDVTACTAVATP